MKTEKSLEKSMYARLHQARAQVEYLDDLLRRIQQKESGKLPLYLSHVGPIEQDIEECREKIAGLVQCFHEYSAYRNSLLTD